MQEPQEFELGDILSVTTGFLVSRDLISGVHRLLQFMAGESIWTHQLPRVGREARPLLLARYPQLTDVVFDPTTDVANIEDWLRKQEAKFGKRLLVYPMNNSEHERIDPLSELIEKRRPDDVIAVAV